jgi:hypothetical protein
MPRRELKDPIQVEKWLHEMSGQLSESGSMILIGSGALLWHAFQKGVTDSLPENSMDVDPVTQSDPIARLCYEALIGSEFEQKHGWHVNLMPDSVLRELPVDWQLRSTRKQYGLLELIVPAPSDLLVPKLKRNEPRDRSHADWTKRVGLL